MGDTIAATTVTATRAARLFALRDAPVLRPLRLVLPRTAAAAAAAAGRVRAGAGAGRRRETGLRLHLEAGRPAGARRGVASQAPRIIALAARLPAVVLSSLLPPSLSTTTLGSGGLHHDIG
eukprot:CAMPEP_0185691432 /NCGR_PEP_ID=MMETSP1164-20130828/1828_1 /TAXON_ID=1104430 /ORGANISM="Chrysoreinhardia sp, Strain CCMP2950" /LENGTH=120 /DNA_ID=CAMNT_0028358093 /DNA_START=159 /DNA_END=523 /DNA_ORIENTATION=-